MTLDQQPTVTSPGPQPKKPTIVKRKAPLWAKICLGLGALLLIVTSGTLGVGYVLLQRYEDNVQRKDLLGPNHSGKKVNGPMNILFIGSDSRASEDPDPNDPSSNQASVTGERADTIMIAHLPATMDRAFFTSIPRDTYLEVPAEEGSSSGSGFAKINSAYAWGGAPLLVKTIENYADITIDHVIVADFSAVQSITDELGGVEVVVDATVFDDRSKRTFHEGVNHLDGAAATDYVRQRYGLPGGDLDRVKRQHQLLHALLSKVSKTNWLTNPSKLDRLMMTITGAITVDKSMPVKDLAFKVKDISVKDLQFLTVPIAGTGVEGDQDVIYTDQTEIQQLFSDIEQNRIEDYLATHPANDVSHGA